MNLAERYTWDCVFKDGRVRAKAGDLAGAVRVSLVPKEGLWLPRRDLMGIKFERCFVRVMHRTRVGGHDKAKYFAEHEKGLTLARKEARKKRDELCGKSESTTENAGKSQALVLDEVLYCVVCEGFRYYVRAWTGQSYILPYDYELYL